MGEKENAVKNLGGVHTFFSLHNWTEKRKEIHTFPSCLSMVICSPLRLCYQLQENLDFSTQSSLDLFSPLQGFLYYFPLFYFINALALLHQQGGRHCEICCPLSLSVIVEIRGKISIPPAPSFPLFTD